MSRPTSMSSPSGQGSRTRGDGVQRALAALRELRDYPGDEGAFHARLTELFARAVAADRAWLLLDDGLRAAAVFSATPEGASRDRAAAFIAQCGPLRSQAMMNGAAVGRTEGEGCVLAIALECGEPRPPAMLLLARSDAGEGWAGEALGFLQVFSDTPKLYYQSRIRTTEAAPGPDRMLDDSVAAVLEINSVLNSHRKFTAIVLGLVNELCARFHADRVSLGWVVGEYVRLKAVSHMDRFEKDLDAVRGAESVMEECLDQDEELLWPRADFVHTTTVVRQHEVYARKKGLRSVLSLPVRVEEEAVAILTLERSDERPFTEKEVMVLQLVCSQVARRLKERQQEDAWIGARLAAEARTCLKGMLGPEHTLLKVCAVGLVFLTAFLCLYPWPYKVAGTFTLKTNDSVFLPAPFEGYVSEVPFEEGDAVKKEDVLVKLDQRELKLDEADALAEITKYRNDAQLALSQDSLAEMRSSLAQAEQSEARLKIVRMKLGQAEIRAPFDGVIVQSDLKERVGKPISKGEVLLRLARLKGMYAEMDVPEEEIGAVGKGARGELAFASRPEIHYPIRIERIHPAAETQDQKNVFVARADIGHVPEDWWRPGMTGVAKVDAGHRPPIWIVTHRAIDQIRLKYLWF